MRDRKSGISAAFCCLLIGLIAVLAGCDPKLSTDQTVLLQTSVTSAKERAAAFAAISSSLKPGNDANAANVSRILSAHGAGLNAEAAALANILHVVQVKGSLNQNLKDSVATVALNSKGWIDTLNQGRALLALTPDQSLWFDAHIAALNQESINLNKLSDSLNAAAPATAPPPAPTTPAAPAK